MERIEGEGLSPKDRGVGPLRSSQSGRCGVPREVARSGGDDA
jgi:hypothetical protein